MKANHGFRISSLDQTLLSSAGILIANPALPDRSPLSPEAVDLFARIALAGPEGLGKRGMTARMWASIADLALPLEIEGLIQWELDKRGQKTLLVLTWKGQEALEAAKQATKPRTVAAQRRASLYK